MSRHRATRVRPRYGRLAAAGTSVAVTAVALLGGTGLLPGVRGSAPALSAATVASSPRTATPSVPSATSAPSAPSAPAATAQPTPTTSAVTPVADAVPAASGHGRRVVFSQSEQRVWLIGPRGNAQRSYLVSGSRLDNLDPGTYQVYSRSRWAVGIDDSGVMQFFVRFTRGPSGAAIGFHSIPTDDGSPVQTVAQLGTRRSHGCIRQDRPDAVAMWRFAPIGTEVDVVA